MNEKLVYFLILGILLVLGYPAGCMVTALQRSGRWLSCLVGVTGIIVFLVGTIAAGADHRFRVLAAGGLCLQFASLVGSIKSRKTPRQHSADLWTSPKHL